MEDTIQENLNILSPYLPFKVDPSTATTIKIQDWKGKPMLKLQLWNPTKTFCFISLTWWKNKLSWTPASDCCPYLKPIPFNVVDKLNLS